MSLRVQRPVAAIATFAVAMAMNTYSPAYAAPDCDKTPDAPICGGEGNPKPLYKRLNLAKHTGAQDYVDFFYNKQTQVLSWTGKTYLGCFAYKQSYVTTYGVTTLKVRFMREFLLPPSWSQLCGSGWNNTIPTTGSMKLPLTQSQQSNFSKLFDSNDTFIGQG